jgi:hypothetical protein
LCRAWAPPPPPRARALTGGARTRRLWGNAFFIRSYNLLFHHSVGWGMKRQYKAAERDDAEKPFVGPALHSRLGSWFLSNRYYNSLKFNMAVYLGQGLFWLVVGLVAQFSQPQPSPFLTSDTDPSNECLVYVYYITVTQGALAILLLVLLAVLLWRVDDSFYIKTELRLLGAPGAARALPGGRLTRRDSQRCSRFLCSFSGSCACRLHRCSQRLFTRSM